MRAVPLREALRDRTRTYHGACACGTVRFVATLDPRGAVPCICARCRGADLRIAPVPDAAFRLITGEGDLTEPLHAALSPHHFFCARCGEACFGRAAGGAVSVNVALLGRGDPAALAPHPDATPESATRD